MRFAIGVWHNMFYFIPTIIWLNESLKMISLTCGKWYIGFNEKEVEE